MTLPIFVALDQAIPNFEAFVQAPHLASEFARVNEISKRAGLKPLASYMGQSSADFDEIFAEDEDGSDDLAPDGSFYDCIHELPEGNDEVWFGATDGVQYVDALIEAVRKAQNELAEGPSIVEELLKFRQVLGRAMVVDAEWHFAV